MELRIIGAVAVAAAALGTHGCAATPPTHGTAASQPDAASAAATVATNAASAAPSADPDRNPFPGMVKRTTRDGQVVYCRTDAGTGSRIPKTVCATERDLRNQAEATRRIVDEIGRTTGGPGCNTPTGC